MNRASLLLVSIATLWSCAAAWAQVLDEPVPVEQWRATQRKPFATDNFTQGLEIHNGVLWVSSGLYGRSKIRRYQLDTLQLINEQQLPDRYFAEGLTRVGDQLLVLTWRARQLLILDPEDLSLRGRSDFPTEGWGLTHRGSTVWFTDGSDRLYRFDSNAPRAQVNSVAVTLNGKPVKRLNELEWVEGEIWANVWQSDQIVRIDPANGKVVGVIDLTALYPRALRAPGSDVLNGIARDPDTGNIWVTGKRWPWLFAIEPPTPNSADTR